MLSLNTCLLIQSVLPLTLIAVNMIPTHPYFTAYALPYDHNDAYKLFVFTPLSILCIASVDCIVITKSKQWQRIVSMCLIAGYLYGFGINQSMNALGNSMVRHRKTFEDHPRAEAGDDGGNSTEVPDPVGNVEQFIMASLTKEWIYYYDEQLGHWVIVLFYGLLQIWWQSQLSSRRETAKEKKSKKNLSRASEAVNGIYRLFISLIGGYMSALLVIESQGVKLMLPIDVILTTHTALSFLSSTPKESFGKSDGDAMRLYLQVSSIVRLVVFAYWRKRFGYWIEPSDIKAAHNWSETDILFAGLTRTDL